MTRRAKLIIAIVLVGLVAGAGLRAMTMAPPLPVGQIAAVESLIKDRCIPFIEESRRFATNGLDEFPPRRRDGDSYIHLATGLVITVAEVDAGHACFIENGPITWDIESAEVLIATMPEIANDWMGSQVELRPEVGRNGEGTIARAPGSTGRFMHWPVGQVKGRFMITLGIANFADGGTS